MSLLQSSKSWFALTQGSALLHPGLERWRPLQGLRNVSHPVKGGIFPAQGAAKRNPGSRQTKTLSSVRATLQLSDALLFDVSGYAAWGLQSLRQIALLDAC